MASQNLNIKVKLDFDETSLKNLNLGTVRVDPDVNHFKSKLRSALNGNFKITPKINTKGISNQLNNIKNDMREFRNAAKDPIKINFDVDKDVLSDLAVVSRQLEKIQKASASATKMKLSGMSGISKTGDDLSTLVTAARKANKEITALEAKKKALESTGRSLSDKDALKLGDFQKQAQEYSNAIEKIIAEKQKLDEQALRSTFKNSEKPTEEETKALAALKEKYATMRAQTEEYSKIGAAQKLVTENNAIQKAQLEAQQPKANIDQSSVVDQWNQNPASKPTEKWKYESQSGPYYQQEVQQAAKDAEEKAKALAQAQQAAKDAEEKALAQQAAKDAEEKTKAQAQAKADAKSDAKTETKTKTKTETKTDAPAAKHDTDAPAADHHAESTVKTNTPQAKADVPQAKATASQARGFQIILPAQHHAASAHAHMAQAVTVSKPVDNQAATEQVLPQTGNRQSTGLVALGMMMLSFVAGAFTLRKKN